MARFFAPPEAWGSSEVHLEAEEARHAAEVLRIQPGQGLTVFDGVGRWASAILRKAGKHGAEAELREVRITPRGGCEMVLVQAIPKGKLMDWILEKATELGVSRVIPVMTERTVVQLGAEEAERKRLKWRRVLIEACKQCGQNWVPVLDQPVLLADFLRREQPWQQSVFGALQEGAVSFSEVLAAVPNARSAGVFIGPEGDFSPGEVDLLVGWGARPVSLGPIVLRVETAAMYSLSILANAYARGGGEDEAEGV